MGVPENELRSKLRSLVSFGRRTGLSGEESSTSIYSTNPVQPIDITSRHIDREPRTDFQTPEGQFVETTIQGMAVRGFVTRRETRYDGTFVTLTPPEVQVRGREPFVNPNLVRRLEVSGGRGCPVNATITLGRELEGRRIDIFGPHTGRAIVSTETTLGLTKELWDERLRAELVNFTGDLSDFIQEQQRQGKFNGSTYSNLNYVAGALASCPLEGLPSQ